MSFMLLLFSSKKIIIIIIFLYHELIFEIILIFGLPALMQLLLYYGDTGSKGTLSDEHVMVSAKCRVCSSALIFLVLIT